MVISPAWPKPGAVVLNVSATDGGGSAVMSQTATDSRYCDCVSSVKRHLDNRAWIDRLVAELSTSEGFLDERHIPPCGRARDSGEQPRPTSSAVAAESAPERRLLDCRDDPGRLVRFRRSWERTGRPEERNWSGRNQPTPWAPNAGSVPYLLVRDPRGITPARRYGTGGISPSPSSRSLIDRTNGSLGPRKLGARTRSPAPGRWTAVPCRAG